MLTNTRVRSVNPTERPQKLTDARGLYLLVTPGGGRYWRYDFSFNGRRRTLALGVYPDVSLARARERHLEAMRLIAEGIDPSATKQAVGQDFETVARAWHEHWKVGRTDHYAQSVKKRLETDIVRRSDNVCVLHAKPGQRFS